MKIEKYTEQLTRLSNEDKYVGDFANNTERDTFMSENIDADIA